VGLQLQKICDPLFISASVDASNFKFGIQLEFVQYVTITTLPRNNFYDQNWWGSELGEHPKKNWDPLFISSTVEASKFKFGTQLRFVQYVTITTLVPNLVGAGCVTGAPQKLWVSRIPYHVPCTTLQLQKCNKTANINVKNCGLDKLTANDTSKTAK